MTYHQELQHRLFQQQEEQVHHMEYQQEFQYYEDVANGRLDRIHLQLLQPKDIVVYNDGEYGMLSKDPLRNLRYHFVVSVAMITRLCVEHGLEQELAYTMSDLYINKPRKRTGAPLTSSCPFRISTERKPTDCSTCSITSPSAVSRVRCSLYK